MNDNESVTSSKTDYPYPDIKENPLDEISITSYILGTVLGISVPWLINAKFVGFPLYLISLSAFHFLEFYVTAKFNPLKVDSNSFLLRNGSGYSAAQLLAICECLIEMQFFSFKSLSTFHTKLIFGLGVCLLVVGQVARSTAMITCGRSFSHRIMQEKQDDHQLVTKGIYQYSRHPSYFGFFWWAVGTQLICLNPISFIVFTVVLWSFFKKRIQHEEQLLIKFFGKEYLDFKETVGVGIPGIH
ncbi:hypothetical protein ACO0RG_003992 [Hanseniaspora osmophila]|uniref:Protein-S-isoprenylcysteine O-methyltransferase n=1 Tax=Hanseniaspora osmophila TaxID=56408 RepID=A0A1E5RAF7_9ASCO|nr:Protein-S-isoprenylcysteine O-methyltransferase [Hanseniaspora osmophila]